MTPRGGKPVAENLENLLKARTEGAGGAGAGAALGRLPLVHVQLTQDGGVATGQGNAAQLLFLQGHGARVRLVALAVVLDQELLELQRRQIARVPAQYAAV